MKPTRPEILTDLLNEDVIYNIKDQSEYIPQLNKLKQDLKDVRMQEAYKNVIKDYFDNNPKTRSFARLKKARPDRPYSVLMVSDEPFLMLPTPPEWKKFKKEGKALSNAAPKILVSLTTGKLKFLKTLRASFLGDTYPKDKARKEHETLKQWGEDVSYLERDTPTGMNCYLLMDHHGLSINDPILIKNVTPSNLFSVLIQTAANLKKIHDRGELHLDVKPANIMYDLDTDKTKLIDAEEVQPDQTVLSSAPGTTTFMHPDRFTYVSGLRVPKTGSIRVCKGDDIFAFLVSIEKILTIAIDKEYNPACKKFLTETLKKFKDKAYTQYAADGSPTHAQRMCDLPTLESLKKMLENASQNYFDIEFAAQANFLNAQPEAPVQAAVIPPAVSKPAPVQEKPKPAPVQYQPQYQQPAPKPAPVQYQPPYQQPAPKPAPVQYKPSAPKPVPAYQPQFQPPSPKLTSHGLNFQYQNQGFPNNPSPRPNYAQQGYPNYRSPRESQLIQCPPSHHAPWEQFPRRKF